MMAIATAAAQRAGWTRPAPLRRPMMSIFHLHNSQLAGSEFRTCTQELRRHMCALACCPARGSEPPALPIFSANLNEPYARLCECRAVYLNEVVLRCRTAT